MNNRFSRRNFVQGLALAGIARPFLRTLGLDPFEGGSAHAATTATPRRVVWMYIPDGLIRQSEEIGTPNGADFNLGTMLTGLAPLKSDVTLLDGVDYRTEQVADTHTQGMLLYLTANGYQASCNGTQTCVLTGNAGGVQNASIDQYLAGKIAGATPFHSVQLGVQPENHGYTISFSGAGTGTGLQSDPDPVNVYRNLFSNVPSGGPDPAAVLRLKLRKSVLDNVTGELSALRVRLGVDDRQKLDQHLDSVRQMENRLAMPPPPPSCVKPGQPGGVNLDDSYSYPAITQAQLDLLRNAFACDLTRVATVQFRACYSSGTTPFAPVNVDVDIHRQSHLDGTDYNGFLRTKQWHFQQIGNFASKLKSTPEPNGDGSLLDNTLIVVCSDIGEGHTHARMPFVLLGGKNMGVRTGNLLQFPQGTPHTKLYVSILNMFGVPDTSFATTQYGTGPLSGFTR